MTTNYHSAIATGEAANAATFNTPLGALDAAIAALDERIDDIEGAGYSVVTGNVATLSNGAASAGQKSIVVDSSSGFVVGGRIGYVLNDGSGTIEYNVIEAIPDGTHLTATTNIGTGGIADNSYISLIPASEYQAAQSVNHGNSYEPTLQRALGNDGHGIYNARNYGALPGASAAVNTAAIQAALTAADAAGGGIVELPLGEYSISSTLSMADFNGVTLRGANTGGHYATGTKLIWAGSAGGVILNMAGCIDCVVSNINFHGNGSDAGTGSTNTGIDVQRNFPTHQASFQNTIEHCFFQNLGVGVSLGEEAGSDQADTYTINKCRFVYDTDGIGVRVRSYNALIITIRDGQFINLGGTATTATAVHVERGSVKLFGCATAFNKYGVRFGATADATNEIYGHHSESDDYPVYTDTGGNHQKARPLTICGFYAYDPRIAFMRFGNANMLYTLSGLFATEVTASANILVSDDVNEVHCTGVILGGSGAILRASDGTTLETVYGWYGNQTTGVWTAKLPPTSIMQKSAGGNVPVVLLNQVDYNEEMIEFTADVGVGAPVEEVAAKTLTTTHFIRVSITGVGMRYIPVGTIA